MAVVLSMEQGASFASDSGAAARAILDACPPRAGLAEPVSDSAVDAGASAAARALRPEL